MKPELDEQLCRKYPALYCDRHADPKISLMCFGFECGDGWLTLIDVISEIMTKHNPDITAIQVKEKFGTLRYYHGQVDDYSFAVEQAAEYLSIIICEICSAPARRNYESGWISYLCKDHNNNYLAEENSSINSLNNSMFDLGYFWSEMLLKLIELCTLHAQQNDMPSALIDANNIDGKLVITAIGGDEFTKGAVDLFSAYANRVDEHTGLPTGSDNEELS